MSSFECHSAFLANVPSAEPSPANPKKKIHALPQPHPRDNNTNNSRSNHSSFMTTSTTTAPSAISASTSSSVGARRNVLVKPSQSFADFFSASTPVPASVTLLLSYTSPAIHGFHRLLQLLTWTSDRSVKSFLVLFGWWALCLGTETFLIFGLHGALILYLGHMWIRSRKVSRIKGDAPQSPAPGTPLSGKFSFSSSSSSRSAFLTPTSARHPTTTQVEQAVTLKEIQEILDHWAAWNRSLDRVESYFDWSDRSTTRLVLALVVLTYVPWLILTYFIPMRFILVVVGSIAICWRAPWFGVLWAVTMKLQAFSPLLQLIPYWPKEATRSAYQKKQGFSVKDIISRAIGQRKKDEAYAIQSYKTSTGYDIEEDHATMYYKFVLYENQRWWLGIEWTPMMLPNDRAPWTDDHLEPTQSKSAFQLPPPHIAHEAIPGQPNKVLRKSQEWRWLDPLWRLKLGSDSDVDGWEYANNHWQKWSGKNRRGAYTRRRAWERTAKLIDQREIVLLEDIEDEAGASEEAEEDQSGEEEEEEEEEEVHH
ncbi:peroxisome- protein [Podila minutissima]|uniref:Peroxisome- protein n=1 Tax=Podila minutissima TaxID=64525 RepID=A0A9P5SLV6_9FUNG|nr:peroxisome- protein [Podila minutissima]